VAKLEKNVFINKGLQILPALFALCLFTNQQARAQYPGGSYYAPNQQQQPSGTAAPQTAYPQSYQQPAQPPAQPTQSVQPTYQQSGYQPSPTGEPDSGSEVPILSKGKSDHEMAVGQVGLALLGIMSMPIVATELDEDTGYFVPRLTEDADLVAPTVGLRYWIGETLGIEVGFGMGFTEGTFEGPAATGTVETDLPETTAFTFHAGVPIALLSSRHFVFEVVPIGNGGYSKGTVYGDPTSDGKWDVSTMLLQVGCRVGAEIHFGFIDVEQLAVQASFGFQFSYLKATAKTEGITENSSRLSLGTTAGSNPWDLFSKSLSAIYYIY
jgi:hypothetical protein